MYNDSVADYAVYGTRFAMDPDPENELNEMINQLNKEENDDFESLVSITVPADSNNYETMKSSEKVATTLY